MRITYIFVGKISIESNVDFIMATAYPIVALLGVITILYRESQFIIIDKAKELISVKVPPYKKRPRVFDLDRVTWVLLRYHGDPTQFPKLSLGLRDEEEIVLSDHVFLGIWWRVPVSPLAGHISREQKLGQEMAKFIGVPYREIKGGEVYMGHDQSDKEIRRIEPDKE